VIGRTTVLVAVAAAAVALCGCGGDDSGKDASKPGAEGPANTRTTKVKVVEGLGARRTFDPEAIYRRLSPGVVTVVSLFGGASNPLTGGGRGGQGSGFVIDAKGFVATNAHVVTNGEGAKARRAKRVFVEFSDGNRVPARIVGDDLNSDVALLKVQPGGLNLTPLRLGSSHQLRVGAPVAAIGSPFGESQSLSIGVISALDRTIDSLTAFSIGNAIQTDAAINPGNSGGPLLNSKGQVLGINSQIKSESGGGEGVGFAVPIDTVRRSLRELRHNGRVNYGYLGVTTQGLYPQLARKLGLPVRSGALVVRVEGGGPAADAGLEAGKDKTSFQGQSNIPTDGDVIIGVDGKRLGRADDLPEVIGRRDAGETVKLEVLRKGKRRIVSVKLAKRPARLPRSSGRP
jgi:S1-C subfamily serine protease